MACHTVSTESLASFVLHLPCFHVSDAILALPEASEVLFWLAGVLAAKVDLKNTVDAQRLLLKPVDGVWKPC